MAHYTNSSTSIIKLQALIRGYLVRKKFLQLKCDYIEIVKCFEGNYAKVRWENDFILSLPIVDHERDGVELLTDDIRPKNSCERIDLSSENELKENELTCANIDDSASSVNCSSEAIPNVESKLNTSTPFQSPVNNWPSKDCLDYDQGLNEGLESRCNVTNCITTEPLERSITLNHRTANGDQIKTDEKRQMNVVDTKNCKDQTLYPSDETSLIKLREDLTMELLWIEQAIDSRIHYLAMKENMNKHLNTD